MKGEEMDRDADRLLWEKVKSEDDLVKAVHMMADLGYGMIASRRRRDNEFQEQLNKLQKVILGNGDPSASLVAKVAVLTEKITATNCEISEIKHLLVGDVVKGGDPTSALVSRVRLLDTKLTTTSEEVSEIKFLLIGDVSKGPDNRSLLDRIQHAQETTNSATRIIWLVLGVVITQIILKIIGLI